MQGVRAGNTRERGQRRKQKIPQQRLNKARQLKGKEKKICGRHKRARSKLDQQIENLEKLTDSSKFGPREKNCEALIGGTQWKVIVYTKASNAVECCSLAHQKI